MLSEDIEAVDSVMNDGGVWSNKRNAWQRIKTALEEAQKTPTNRPIIPCCPECGTKLIQEEPYCPNIKCKF